MVFTSTQSSWEKCIFVYYYTSRGSKSISVVAVPHM
jgi:hypothetical protein